MLRLAAGLSPLLSSLFALLVSLFPVASAGFHEPVCPGGQKRS